MHDRTYFRELFISNAANGYRDLLAKVDLQSFRRIPWEHAGAGHDDSRKGVPFFLVSFYDPTSGEPIPPCPRGSLASVVKKVTENGWKAMAGGWFSIIIRPWLLCTRLIAEIKTHFGSGIRVFQFSRNAKDPWR